MKNFFGGYMHDKRERMSKVNQIHHLLRLPVLGLSVFLIILPEDEAR